MSIQLLTGWHFIQVSQKRHYFRDGRSLCDRFYAVCKAIPVPTSPEFIHFYNCVPCERKLKTGSVRKGNVSRRHQFSDDRLTPFFCSNLTKLGRWKHFTHSFSPR